MTQLAAGAAQVCGLPEHEVRTLRRAALLHDVGLHGVAASILDKPGALSSAEWERVRLHAYWTERVLARPPALARVGAVASLANERLDGSGYHRGLSAAAIPATGRLLAAAGAYQVHEPASSPPPCAFAEAGLRRAARRGPLGLAGS